MTNSLGTGRIELSIAISSADEQVPALVEGAEVPVSGSRHEVAHLRAFCRTVARALAVGAAGGILPDRRDNGPRRIAVSDRAVMRQCRRPFAPTLDRHPCDASRLIACLLLAARRWPLRCAGAPAGDTKPEQLPPQRQPSGRGIAAADIPMRADADERFAQDVVAARDSRSGGKLGPQLDALAAGRAQAAESFKQDELSLLSAIRLESLRATLEVLRHRARRLARRAAARHRPATPKTQRNSPAGAPLWEATRAAAGASAAPALADRIDSVLAEITLAEQALSGPLDNQLRLGRRGNAVRAGIDCRAEGRRGRD